MHDDDGHLRIVPRRGEVALLDVRVWVHPDDLLDVAQAARTRRDVDVLAPGRLDERLLDDGDEVGIEHLVAAQCHQAAGVVRPDVVRLSAVRAHRHHPDARAPGRHDDGRAESIHAVDARRRILLNIGTPVARCVDRCGGDAERLGVEVRDDEEAIALGSGRVLPSPPTDRRASARASATSSYCTCIRRVSVSHESSHSPTSGMTTSSIPIRGCSSMSRRHAAS